MRPVAVCWKLAMHPLKQIAARRSRPSSRYWAHAGREAGRRPHAEGAAAGPAVAPQLRVPGSGQTCPAFSSAEQQVSTMSRVTTYGSTFAFGRRSSMYPLPSFSTCHGMRTDAPRSETP